MSASKAALFKLINDNNPAITLSDDNCILGAPETVDIDGVKGNTKVLITANADGLSGRVAVYYDRVDISSVVIDESLLFVFDNIVSSSDLLTVFNTRFKTQLAVEDIVVEALELDAGEVQDYTFTIHANSYGYVGTLDLTIKRRLEEDVTP